MTGVIHPHRAQERRLPRIVTLRDVHDVERRVEEALEGLGLSIPEHELDTLILDAIGLAYRIERALPPEQSSSPFCGQRSTTGSQAARRCSAGPRDGALSRILII